MNKLAIGKKTILYMTQHFLSVESFPFKLKVNANVGISWLRKSTERKVKL